MSKVALRLLPSGQLCIYLRSVFLKLWVTPDPRNDEWRRNLHETGRTSRTTLLIPWRRACTPRETSKKFLYTHFRQPDRIKDPARKPSSKAEQTLIEIGVRIAHVGVLRLVTDFRRKFRVAAMNIRNVRRQQRLIAVVPNGKRKGQDLNKTGYLARCCASRSLPNAIAGSR